MPVPYGAKGNRKTHESSLVLALPFAGEAGPSSLLFLAPLRETLILN